MTEGFETDNIIRFKTSARSGESRIDHISSLAVTRKEKQLAVSLWDKSQINVLVGNYPVRLEVKHFSVLGRVDFNQYSMFKNKEGSDVMINPFANFLITRNFNKAIYSLGHIIHFSDRAGFQQRVTAVQKTDGSNVYVHNKVWYSMNGFYASANFNTLMFSALHKNYYNVSLGWEDNGVSVGAKFGSKIQEIGEAPARLDKFSLSMSKDFRANGKAGLQFKQDFKDQDKSRVAVVYENTVGDNLLVKTRVDKDLNIGLFARYRASNNWVIKSAFASNIMHKYQSPGFLGQPVDFSIDLEYNP